MRTQHEMVCVGLGMEPDTPLSYAVTLSHPRFIGTTKLYYKAKSEEEAGEMATFDRPDMTVESAELI